MLKPARFLSGFVALVLAGLIAPYTLPAADVNGTRIEQTSFQVWSDAWVIRNELIEAIVVPQVGRVMSFRFRDGENIFWTDRSLDGKQGDPTGASWVNFGGDKTWPAPEAGWREHSKRPGWMPPPAFDSMPITVRADGPALILTSPIDPYYGIRTIRRITLRPNAAVMEIETTYERVSGEPSYIAVWVITQFAEPVGVYVPIPATSAFENGHYIFNNRRWSQLTTVDGMLRMTRDPATSHKMGSDADRMLWVGQGVMCLVASPRVPGAEYPDRGVSIEVYTNPDPKPYVELETLGPLSLVKPGDRIRQTNTYTLVRRTRADPDAEARTVFGQGAVGVE